MAAQRVDAAAIRDAVDIFYQRLLGDPAVSDVFRDTDMRRLHAHQRAFLLQALGGPALYSGRDMKTAHEQLHITDEQFDLTLEHLLVALAGVGVAADVIDRAAADVAKLRAVIVAA